MRGPQVIVAVHDGDSDSLCALKLGNAGGVAVAHHDGQGIVSSDLPALLPIVGRRGHLPVGFLEDGEVAVVKRQGIAFLDRNGRQIEKTDASTSTWTTCWWNGVVTAISCSRKSWSSPRPVTAALRDRVDFGRGLVTLPDLTIAGRELAEVKRVVLIGCGTSLNAAQVGRHLVERLAGVPAEAESASEFRYREPFLDASALVVAIGQSGETADTVAAMAAVRNSGARLVTICNAANSQATRLADHALLMGCGVEVGVASTKTFLSSLTLLNLLAMRLGTARGHLGFSKSRELADGLARLPGHVAEALEAGNEVDRLSRHYYGRNHFLYLGRGVNSPVATEGALKLKEVSYIHAEAYAAGEMKHGPIALIDHAMPTLALGSTGRSVR